MAMNEGFKVSKLPTENGSESVKDALIEAACEMLAESGPRSMSVRKVAARAEVNHGQVHHYFGGKQGLIEAAMAQMSEEHYENARLRSGRLRVRVGVKVRVRVRVPGSRLRLSVGERARVRTRAPLARRARRA